MEAASVHTVMSLFFHAIRIHISNNEDFLYKNRLKTCKGWEKRMKARNGEITVENERN
jgi:hypothetical protein